MLYIKIVRELYYIINGRNHTWFSDLYRFFYILINNFDKSCDYLSISDVEKI